MGSRLESNSNAVRKRIASHTFDDEEGDEYEGSAFGGFPEYFRRKKLKLQNRDADIRAQNADKPPIFKGVVAHVNGYTQPSLNDLHKLIVQHGGGFMQYLDGKTTATHIIASNLTPKKAVEFRRYRIVKPAWVVNSIEAGRLLPWNDYRVLDEGENQKVLAFGPGKVSAEVSKNPRSYKDQTESSWYTNQLRGTPSRSQVPTLSRSQLDTHARSQGETPTSSARSRFARQALPSPGDDTEDLPPSYQWDISSSDNLDREADGKSMAEIITPPKTSPNAIPQKSFPLSEIAENEIEDDVGPYYDPAPPDVAPESAQPDPVEVSRAGTDCEVAHSDPTRPLTAEEHNAILLRDPKIRKSTVVDPNFLEQYYRESRLHHLSTWKADLKSQLQALASEISLSQKTKHKRVPGSRRYILHVDFDSFFAAVSLQNHPQWKDKPAVVAHGNGSGSEIASCNYPARKFGIKNGMWMKRAQELCPELKILPYDFPAYEETSRAFYDAILATDGIVQSVSIDEALIDVSTQCIESGGSDGKRMSEGSVYREQAKADEIAQSLRDQVKKKTDCNVSVGIGGNILLAKLALRKAKPAGQYQIKPDEVLDFVGALQVQDLPGVAWSIGGKLEEIGIKFVKDIREFTKERLVQTLGPKTGEKLWEYSRGIDKTEVGEQVVRKSVSAEVNWGVRFENQEQAEEFIENLCGELQKRLLKEKVKGKQFTMKFMRRSPDAPLDPPKHLGHGKCDTYNKSVVLGVATNAKEILTKEALSMLRGFGFSPGELRGIGIQMTKLESMKSANDGSLESSQRRLQFKVKPAEAPTSVSKPTRVAEADPIQDDPETPKKPGRGSEHIAFGPQELNVSTPSRRPLNTFGTQFLLPTPGSKDVSEAPEDIRSRLLRQSRPSSSPQSRNQQPEPTTPSRYEKNPPFAYTALPAQSQLDPEILAALPSDVRKEVLLQYAAGATPASPSRRRRGADQTLLPQSPRKNRIIGIPAKKPIVPPVKRGRGRPPKSAQLAASAAATAKGKDGRTLRQASFFFAPKAKEEQAAGQAASERHESPPMTSDSDASEAFLDAEAQTIAIDKAHPDTVLVCIEPISPDSRLIASEKASPLSMAEPFSDLDTDLDTASVDDDFLEDPPRSSLSPEQQLSPTSDSEEDASQRRPIKPITLPRPEIPTFSASHLTREPELRAAVKAWVQELRDEGPSDEDVEALATYLGKVVLEERDMSKAVRVVKWLVWIIDEKVSAEAKGPWDDAVGNVKEGVRKAVREWGLADISFD